MVAENLIQIKSTITINVGTNLEIKNKKNNNKKTIDYIWNNGVCSCENGKYFSSIIDISVTTCD